jgi:hypothetical protein
MEEKKYSAKRNKERDKHNNRSKRWMDYRIIGEEEEEMNCKKITRKKERYEKQRTERANRTKWYEGKKVLEMRKQNTK